MRALSIVGYIKLTNKDVYEGLVMTQVKVNLYCDESYVKDSINNTNWHYYGLLIIPTEKKNQLYRSLLDARCIEKNHWVLGGCEDRCDYHERNNTEIHYSEIASFHEYKIAKNWIDLLLDECKHNRRMIYLNILGLNMSYINRDYWKHYQKKELKIHSRFLITVIKSIKYFFWNHEKIEIQNIAHDCSPIQDDASSYYNRLITDLWLDEKIKLNTRDISYINSDHRKSNNLVNSHLLQYIALILGLTVNYIHYRSRNKRKVKLTKQLSQLVSQLIHKHDYIDSGYNHVGQKQIQFFPKSRDFYTIYRGLNGNTVREPKDNMFYHDRPCRFEELYRSESQQTLEEALKEKKR